MAIVVAGATVNIIFGLLVYFLLIAISGTYGTRIIDTVTEGLPAYNAGICANDEIVKVNGKKVRLYSDVVMAIAESGENETQITVLRNCEEKTFSLKPEIKEEDETTRLVIGVTFKPSNNSLKDRLYYAFFGTGKFVSMIGQSVGQIFTKGISTEDMAGPIGISKTVADTSSVFDFVYLLAVISISLGITNLLPIPALDGGKILILIIEAIRRKPMKENTEIVIQLIGFSFLILLSIYISYLDVLRFF